MNKRDIILEVELRLLDVLEYFNSSPTAKDLKEYLTKQATKIYYLQGV